MKYPQVHQESAGHGRFRGVSWRRQEQGFTCLHCHGYVDSSTACSGVCNRNHCPYCLWSRHLDLHAAGDRLSACKAGMQPIGLTFKRSAKKYCPGHGELMLVHLCVECSRLSVNRLAADDHSGTVYELFHVSLGMDCTTKTCLSEAGINILERLDTEAVRRQLFGWKNRDEVFSPDLIETSLAVEP
jgi:hypothetical protein